MKVLCNIFMAAHVGINKVNTKTPRIVKEVPEGGGGGMDENRCLGARDGGCSSGAGGWGCVQVWLGVIPTLPSVILCNFPMHPAFSLKAMTASSLCLPCLVASTSPALSSTSDWQPESTEIGARNAHQ